MPFAKSLSEMQRSTQRGHGAGSTKEKYPLNTSQTKSPLGTTDEYFQAPEPDEEYILTLCGDTVIFSSGLLAEALSRLDEREREMIYLSFFKRIPQHEIGRQYGRSRSTAGYHIRKALRQLQAEMEGMAYEK